MSEFETQNEPFEISEELEALFKIRNQLELQINILSEQCRFIENIDGGASLSTFINSFLNQFKEHFSRSAAEQDLEVLYKMMDEVVQQIKGVCKHQYEEDHIDIMNGCCEESKKITYCTICYSTF
jgi:hypothetical protein